MMQRRQLVKLWIGLVALVLGACGGSDTGTGAVSVPLTVKFLRGGEGRTCGQVGGVTHLDVSVYAPPGNVLRGGFPQRFDCVDSLVLQLPAGDQVIEVVARGTLGSDSEAALYRIRSEIGVDGAPLALVLLPEVAFLELAWTFGSDNLAPCGTEVELIQVRVATGGSQAPAFEGAFPCGQGSAVLPAPLELTMYTIDVVAPSAEGFPLFTHQARRLLDRGDNQYTALLQPQGGRLYLDWEFGIGSNIVRDCASREVGVQSIKATVLSREGGTEVSETILCTEARPYAFRAARFTQGRQLSLVLEAEGQARFVAREDFTMTAGDRSGERLVMVPVGTATVSFAATSSCTLVNWDATELTVSPVGQRGGPAPLEQRLGRDVRSAVLNDLPYGRYRVQLVQRLGSQKGCQADEEREIAARQNEWVPFELRP